LVIQAGFSLNFAILDFPLGDSFFEAYPHIISYPLFVDGIVPSFNIPGLPANLTLVLSREVLVDIFAGDINKV
jgi:ABC-type phosphate transport system substrate-binding protein